MKIKEGASIQGLDIRMRPVLITANRIWEEHLQKLVITCGLDGEHSAGSLHYYGLAVDLRTNYFTPDEVVEIAEQLQDELGCTYDVIVHRTHIHVEYDP